MKQITLRGLPAEVQKVITKESRRKNQSINRTIISLLERTVSSGTAKSGIKTIFHDLDHLAGTWSDKETHEFNEELEDLRQVDEGMWE